jgi:hypothetical protein
VIGEDIKALASRSSPYQTGAWTPSVQSAKKAVEYDLKLK